MSKHRELLALLLLVGLDLVPPPASSSDFLYPVLIADPFSTCMHQSLHRQHHSRKEKKILIRQKHTLRLMELHLLASTPPPQRFTKVFNNKIVSHVS